MTTVLKIDIDLDLDITLIYKWIDTRIAILRCLGYTPLKIRVKTSRSNWHSYITIKEDVDDVTKAELQFLLGDDHKRAYYNLWRAYENVNENFNVLFSIKRERKNEVKQE